MSVNDGNISNIEKIECDGLVIAHIIYKDYENEGIEFFSSNEYPLQLGSMKHSRGHKVSPHIHNPVKRNTVGTQEVLFIKKGKVKIDFYSPEQVFLKSRELSAGDIILFAGAGHGIEVLEDAVIVEVKNGPFAQGSDKVKFEGKRGQV